MHAAVQNPAVSPFWLQTGVAFLLLVGVVGVVLFSYALRRFLYRTDRTPQDELGTLKPRSDNPSAFMAASMQAVIQRLREQEKELERLHRLEKERAEQTERLSEAVTRNMPAGMILINATGIISSANPAAEVALGLQSLAYRRYTEALGADSALSRLVTECLGEARTFRREVVEYAAPNGDFRQLGVTISPILHGPREVAGALCLLSDLTELTALQKQVRIKENLAALGELSAGIAHEFKNSLATISGYAQMIRGEVTSDDVRENAQRILEQTRALTHVVTEFLKFARPLDLADEEVPMRALAERVRTEVCEAMPQVEVTVEGDFVAVSGDEGLLRQALLNLTRNAAEAASGQPSGGRVTLHGSIDAGAASAMQRISVGDNGPGISPQELTKIFVPFYTTKANGTGMGLAIVQKIVVQHGGVVEARNQPEGGAEFIVWLPLRREAAQTVDLASKIAQRTPGE